MAPCAVVSPMPAHESLCRSSVLLVLAARAASGARTVEDGLTQGALRPGSDAGHAERSGIKRGSAGRPGATQVSDQGGLRGGKRPGREGIWAGACQCRGMGLRPSCRGHARTVGAPRLHETRSAQVCRPHPNRYVQFNAHPAHRLGSPALRGCRLGAVLDRPTGLTRRESACPSGAAGGRAELDRHRRAPGRLFGEQGSISAAGPGFEGREPLQVFGPAWKSHLRPPIVGETTALVQGLQAIHRPITCGRATSMRQVRASLSRPTVRS